MRARLTSICIVLSVVIALGAAPAYAEGGTVYVVKRGDTLYGIARQHSVSVAALAQANGLTTRSWVYVGQRLAIPGTQDGTVTVVRRGDTLYSLARRFCTTVVAIQRANGLSGSRIRVGQRLVIPGGCGVNAKNVDGWSGVVIKLPAGNQFGQYFLRDDGQRYDIGSSSAAITTQIAEACWTGARIRVWGRLETGVPALEARHIEVERLEITSGPSVEARNLTPFATSRASSRLRADRWGQYDPWMATDGNQGTAWAEGVAGSGAGEWIELTFPGTVEPQYVAVNVGYDSRADTFAKNNRIRRATLIFSNGEQIEATFADQRGLQIWSVAPPPDSGSTIRTTSVKLVIREVYPGTKYDDTCVAEIEVVGTTR